MPVFSIIVSHVDYIVKMMWITAAWVAVRKRIGEMLRNFIELGECSTLDSINQ